jgi:hypothetical protein
MTSLILAGALRLPWRASQVRATHVIRSLSGENWGMSSSTTMGDPTTTEPGKTKKPSQDIKVEKVVKEACGDMSEEDENDDEMEQEEMFVEAHKSFKHQMIEWGGPRRGGRLPEPTRYGDWERKGRCTDF